MVRVNLATRPFYNERLVSFIIAVVGVIAVGVLAFSVQQIVSLSSKRTELRGRIAQADAATNRANVEAAEVRKSIDTRKLKGLAFNAAVANRLIDERTFSWTVFFSLIGKTLPDDVRIDSVAPSIDERDGVIVLMTVVSKRTDDLAQFIERLQATGAFYDVFPQQEDATDDGNRRTTVIAHYLAPKEPAPAAETAATAPKPATTEKTPAKAGGAK